MQIQDAVFTLRATKLTGNIVAIEALPSAHCSSYAFKTGKPQEHLFLRFPGQKQKGDFQQDREKGEQK